MPHSITINFTYQTITKKQQQCIQAFCVSENLMLCWADVRGTRESVGVKTSQNVCEDRKRIFYQLIKWVLDLTWLQSSLNFYKLFIVIAATQINDTWNANDYSKKTKIWKIGMPIGIPIPKLVKKQCRYLSHVLCRYIKSEKSAINVQKKRNFLLEIFVFWSFYILQQLFSLSYV